MLTVIEDCSPYYIRFTHEKIEDVISFGNSFVPPIKSLLSDFTHLRLSNNDSKTMLSLVPISKQLDLEVKRVKLFISKPGLYYPPHKDGPFCRFSINYTIRVLDDKCVTSWYSDQDLIGYDFSSEKSKPRKSLSFDKEKHIPLKTMIAKPNEGILFNTDIFHDWDNNSPNERVVLTLHTSRSVKSNTYFDDAKKILFNL